MEASTDNRAKASTQLYFRPDIQGLRAIAVIVVMIFHIWPRIAGGGYVGVDVFFVISGYLITGLLIRELEKSDTISIYRFYARRIRRLVPCATLVLVVSGLLAFFLLPATQWRNTAHGILASALYLENWDLIHKSANYLNAFFPPTPLQHYWSLSVEGQFYVFWPLFLLLINRIVLQERYHGKTPALFFAGLTALLFACSVVICHSASVPAYFSTATRIWELTLGGMIVFFERAAPSKIRYSFTLGWLGIAAIALACLAFSNNTLFPGYAALLPTLGAALIIWIGSGNGGQGVSGLLALPPLRYIGDISYSMYLWHWPIVIFFKETWGPNIGLFDGIAIFALTLLLSHCSWTLVEQPFHRPPKGHRLFNTSAFGLGAFCSGISAAFALALLGYLTILQRSTLNVAPDSTQYPGAQALGQHVPPRPFIPSVFNARYDEVASEKNGCIVSYEATKLHECRYGIESSNRLLKKSED